MSRLVLCVLLGLPMAAQTTKKSFDIWALNRVAQVSDPQLSPDGSRLAYVVGKVFLSENLIEQQIYVVDVDGGRPVQLTFEGEKNLRPRWTPDGAAIVYSSDRSGTAQVWTLQSSDRDARQLTNLSTEVHSFRLSPDGATLVYASDVFPDCGADDGCNARELEQREQDPVKARIYDGLLYRHWNEWDDGRRSRLFARPLNDPEAGATALTPAEYDVPSFSLGGLDAYDIAPDGAEVCYAVDTSSKPERSTNADLYVVPIDGGEPVRITDNPAADLSPLYSPDGRFIAYRSQTRPGYESDRFRLSVYTRASGELHSLTETLDRSVTSLAWAVNASRLFFTAEDQGREPIFTVRSDGGGVQMAVYGNATHADLQLSPDGQAIFYSAHSGTRPAEIYRGIAAGGPPQQITHANDALFDDYETSELEEVTYQSTDGAEVSGFIVKPPDYSFEHRYPLLTLIHGGPQGSWGEKWSTRWNPQIYAGAGYVVFMPNPRGSTGYGQAFTDSIRNDYGGRAFDDILAGVDHIIARPYVDATRLTAAGGSFGGYMVNWMLGRTTRFRAFVSHAGIYDLESFFGSTEELWFPLWDLAGAPWERPKPIESAGDSEQPPVAVETAYERWSPSRNAANFKTPTLVIHGELDYRVPASQGLQLFTALQVRDVPSRLLYFPDEGHWILKPRNRVLWYETVLDWLDRWSRP